MTNQEAIKHLTAKVNCIKRKVSGTDMVCIHRKCDVCELCYAKGTMGEQIEAISMGVKAMEAQEWIPVSERLPEHPENGDYYLVTIQCEHYDGWDDYVTGFAEWTKHGWDEISCYIGQIKVVAWMPLPEPYREEGNDKDRNAYG